MYWLSTRASARSRTGKAQRRSNIRWVGLKVHRSLAVTGFRILKIKRKDLVAPTPLLSLGAMVLVSGEVLEGGE